ncbi:MAG: carbon-nitrogen family hydrolase [Candidatus Margulisiibacteriota bacterium]
MKKITVSLIQMDIKTAHVEENLLTASKLIEKAIKRQSNYIVLPEMWATGFAYENLSSIAKNYFDEIISFMTGHAKEAKAYIVGGSIPESESGNTYNTSLIISPAGKIIGKFRKVHAFSPYGEDRHFAGGKYSKPVETDHAKIGAVICYDLRFPELTRKLSLDGMEILFLPAQFPFIREQHWEILLQARAIENAIFACGCNRTGTDRKHEYKGGSMIVSPWGKILEKGSDKEETITADIDLKKISEAREIIPIYKDRKPEAY